MRGEQRTANDLDQSLAEAARLCERAERLRSAGVTGDVAAEACVAFAGPLAHEVRDWLGRADAKARAARAASDALCRERLVRLRGLIDCANVAIMKRSESRTSWTRFYRLAQGREATSDQV